jgi:hypothetical protein
MLMTGVPPACKAKDLPLQLKFIVGKRDKSELMCLGGPWVPADGADPGNNPNTLINTAIRTVKEQTDVDLSGCTQWSRFAELHYTRSEQEGDVREVSVLFVPDVWSALPRYEDFAASFKARLAAKRKEEEAKAEQEAKKKQEEEKAAKEVVDPNALEIDESEPAPPQDEAAKAAAAEKAKEEAEAAEKAKEEARKRQEEEDEKAVPKEVSLQVAPRHLLDPRIKNMVRG